MKVPPKRKGNFLSVRVLLAILDTLNESPSEKEGKCGGTITVPPPQSEPLNESPSEKEGKYWRLDSEESEMGTLNESPSEKEGKCRSSGPPVKSPLPQ